MLDVEEFLHFAATLIQSAFRGFSQRRLYRLQKRQADIDRHNAKIQLATDQRHRWASSVIQRAWRCYSHRKTFEFYRDMITFKQQCDPRQVLRHINPAEANLIDAAAGVHLRFRLGGSCFPPILFYKIYTHRPVADIGAFGPRNYAAEVPVASVDLSSLPAPQPSAGTGHSLASTGTRHAPSCLEAEFQIPAAQRRFVRPDGSIGLRSAIGWYQRRENNGWRPVNEVRMLDSEDDCAPAAQRPATHFKASVRREERARRQRQRHCEWMAALYRGRGEEGSEAPAPTCKHHEGAVPGADGDVLAWSQHLDFDAYSKAWSHCATTLGSEAMVPVDESSYLASANGAGLQKGDPRLAWHARAMWAPLSMAHPVSSA